MADYWAKISGDKRRSLRSEGVDRGEFNRAIRRGRTSSSGSSTSKKSQPTTTGMYATYEQYQRMKQEGKIPPGQGFYQQEKNGRVRWYNPDTGAHSAWRSGSKGISQGEQYMSSYIKDSVHRGKNYSSEEVIELSNRSVAAGRKLTEAEAQKVIQSMRAKSQETTPPGESKPSWMSQDLLDEQAARKENIRSSIVSRSPSATWSPYDTSFIVGQQSYDTRAIQQSNIGSSFLSSAFGQMLVFPTSTRKEADVYSAMTSPFRFQAEESQQLQAGYLGGKEEAVGAAFTSAENIEKGFRESGSISGNIWKYVRAGAESVIGGLYASGEYMPGTKLARLAQAGGEYILNKKVEDLTAEERRVVRGLKREGKLKMRQEEQRIEQETEDNVKQYETKLKSDLQNYANSLILQSKNKYGYISESEADRINKKVETEGKKRAKEYEKELNEKIKSKYENRVVPIADRYNEKISKRKVSEKAEKILNKYKFGSEFVIGAYKTAALVGGGTQSAIAGSIVSKAFIADIVTHPIQTVKFAVENPVKTAGTLIVLGKLAKVGKAARVHSEKLRITEDISKATRQSNIDQSIQSQKIQNIEVSGYKSGSRRIRTGKRTYLDIKAKEKGVRVGIDKPVLSKGKSITIRSKKPIGEIRGTGSYDVVLYDKGKLIYFEEGRINPRKGISVGHIEAGKVKTVGTGRIFKRSRIPFRNKVKLKFTNKVSDYLTKTKIKKSIKTSGGTKKPVEIEFETIIGGKKPVVESGFMKLRRAIGAELQFRTPSKKVKVSQKIKTGFGDIKVSSTKTKPSKTFKMSRWKELWSGKLKEPAILYKVSEPTQKVYKVKKIKSSPFSKLFKTKQKIKLDKAIIKSSKSQYGQVSPFDVNELIHSLDLPIKNKRRIFPSKKGITLTKTRPPSKAAQIDVSSRTSLMSGVTKQIESRIPEIATIAAEATPFARMFPSLRQITPPKDREDTIPKTKITPKPTTIKKPRIDTITTITLTSFPSLRQITPPKDREDFKRYKGEISPPEPRITPTLKKEFHKFPIANVGITPKVKVTPIEDTRITPKQITIPKTKITLKPTTIEKPRIDTITTITPTPPPPVVPTVDIPLPPLVALPHLPSGMIFPTRGKKYKRKKRKSGYTPTISGVFSGKFIKEAPIGKTFTGFEKRYPILRR